METMNSVAVMEVAPVPDPPFENATPLTPPPPTPLEALTLRRSARCLNMPRRPSYAEQERPKQPSGRGRGGDKRKIDEESPEPQVTQEAKKPGRKAAKADPGEREPMPVIAAVPVSCAGVTGAAAKDDVMGSGKSAKLRVKETLRAFNSHYLHFVQEEQKRAQAALQEIEAKGCLKRQTKGGKNKGSKQDAEVEEKEKRPSKRPDLKAITKMQETNAVLYPEKRIGHLPGIDVGDRFYSRAEMVVLGIHSHWLNGIDYMGVKYEGKKEYENLTFPLATCIVMSGIYEDDLDKADEIIYTGQGGNDLLGNHRQIGSQQLKRGNLALKNSRDNGNPIRVIRGHVSKNSYTGKVYTYDGLYKVVDDWVQNGVQGHVVFKYKLKRLEGQPSLTTSEVRFTRAEAPTTISELPGLVCDDISGGQESIPIPATNLVDDPPVPPSGFTYSKSLKVPKGIKIPSNIIGCDCEGDCASNKNCSCAQRNGSDLPYVSYKNIGRLVEPKAVVFECGANCSCNHDCVNRTSQQGLQYRLEVFKTASKGWGVRTWDTILPGAPICEYTGVLRRTEDLDGLQNNYVFDIDCLQTMKGLDGREKRAGSEMHLPNLHPENDSEAPPAPEYCIDASSIGNFARFINHSCQPNLFVQCVLSSHNDVKLAKVTLFAADTILPLQELSYDYGYRLDSVVGPDGNIVKLPCYCGAPDCRKRLY
ncbi:histone-lysine N-methyltransferase, H3 lysine-9 specific SUVH4-like isoform X4 [Phragmites australis]|uniref:histone-lysine N-methyltransferase, H3 lysine-9 specific SUVH4-like isoform X4 n=1 Tax=Phragmites australis TaxID=29695 RepID=UPI002D78FE0A|nr:histone-lysine N-methyltransferase, H3 lysine-9 specific SUVH4-like isoform X4 [Phragmites australis]